VNDVALDALDVACGMVIGSVPGATTWSVPASDRSPLEMVEQVVLEGLCRPPCLISFSGGRDSSSLLAVAAHVAGREGLPAPIPITARFEAAETEESEWQQLVVKHLGIDDWVKVAITDQLDLLGPLGCGMLRRHGLRYPQNAHFQAPLLERAIGGSLLSGAGGDELFEPHRFARAGLVLARAARPRRSDLLVVGAALSPRPVRVRVHHRGQLTVPDWLTTSGRRALLKRVHRWLAGDRIRYDAHLRWWRHSRYLTHGQRSFELLAADHDVHFLAPYSDERVLRALATDQGRTGFASRTAALDHLFGDLLPRAIIERQSKATFLSPLVGEATRAFAEVAEPAGLLREEWVDPWGLKRAWQQEQVDVRSLLALQLCWMVTHLPDGAQAAPAP
jgi:hypothetical protein